MTSIDLRIQDDIHDDIKSMVEGGFQRVYNIQEELGEELQRRLQTGLGRAPVVKLRSRSGLVKVLFSFIPLELDYEVQGLSY